MAKVSRVEELPDWFSLEKYCECDVFTAADWHLNLWVRSEPWHYFVSPEQQQLLDINLITDMLDGLRDEPIMRSKAAPLTQPIRSLRFADLAERALSDRRQPDTARIWSEIMSFNGAESRELRASINSITTIFDSGHPVMVDLRATDAVLVGAFKVWLKEIRVRQAGCTASRRERPAYWKWAGYGLLPYLDLMIWSKEKGLEITLETLTSALLPSVDPIGNTRIKDTVGPLAVRLMSDLSELQAVAAIEGCHQGKRQ